MIYILINKDTTAARLVNDAASGIVIDDNNRTKGGNKPTVKHRADAGKELVKIDDTLLGDTHCCQ